VKSGGSVPDDNWNYTILVCLVKIKKRKEQWNREKISVPNSTKNNIHYPQAVFRTALKLNLRIEASLITVGEVSLFLK